MPLGLCPFEGQPGERQAALGPQALPPEAQVSDPGESSSLLLVGPASGGSVASSPAGLGGALLGRACLLPKPACCLLPPRPPGSASECGERGSEPVGRGARRPNHLCVLRTGQQSQPQSSQPDYSKAWEDYYKKQSECFRLFSGRSPSRGPRLRAAEPGARCHLRRVPCMRPSGRLPCLLPRRPPQPCQRDARVSFAALPSSIFPSGLRRGECWPGPST